MVRNIIYKIFSQIGFVVSYNKKIFNLFLRSISTNHKVDMFFTYHLRPKKIYNIIDDSIKINSNKEKVGVVIQGPIIDKEFINETLKLYKTTFNSDEIILSTWKGLNYETKKYISDLGVHLVESDKPDNGGFLNLNYQIISTKSGIKKAKELGCKYILKTRTDVRIYETGVSKFLINLLDTFPSNSKSQDNRIIGIDINTHKYGIGISDVFQFGTMVEMEKMWNIDLYSKNISAKEYHEFEKNSTAIERFDIEFAECYLLKNYLKKIDEIIYPTLKEYYKKLANNFIIIDDTMINMFWNKYLGDEYKGWKNYDKTIKSSSMKFKDWITIYNDIDNIETDETILSKTYKEWEKNIYK